MTRATTRVLFAMLVASLALAAAGCPDPKEVGHAPKEQIDMAKERLDRAADKAAVGLQDAAKAADAQ